MNATQLKKLKMYMALRTLFAASTEILKSIPNADEYVKALDAAILQIQSDDKLQNGTSDLTNQKAEYRNTLNDLMINASRKMMVYADDIKDNALLEAVKFTPTEIKHLQEMDMVQKSSALCDKIDTLIDELTSYGITVETQAAFKAAIGTYQNAIPETKKGRQDSKDMTGKLDSDFDTADAVLSKLDMRVEMLKPDYPSFYTDYKALRKLEANHSFISLKAKVTDSESGAPVPNATVVFSTAGSPDISKNTTEQGGFQIKDLDSGIYSVKVSKLGYQTQMLSITVTGDNMYSLDVKLLKA